MEYCLETHDLCKSYGRFKALSGLTLHVPKGAIYGLVGRNGAGKTTLLRLICGLQRPDSGHYTIYGVDGRDRNIGSIRRRMGAVVGTPAFCRNMTARDNLVLQYKALGLPSYDGIDEILRMVGLSDTGQKKAKHFSLGMKQRLGIAVALCGHPDFIVLDEPVNGMDPEGIVEIRELILRLNREQQITFLISSHRNREGNQRAGMGGKLPPMHSPDGVRHQSGLLCARRHGGDAGRQGRICRCVRQRGGRIRGGQYHPACRDAAKKRLRGSLAARAQRKS